MEEEIYYLLLTNGRCVLAARNEDRDKAHAMAKRWNHQHDNWTGLVVAPPRRCVALVRTVAKQWRPQKNVQHPEIKSEEIARVIKNTA